MGDFVSDDACLLAKAHSIGYVNVPSEFGEKSEITSTPNLLSQKCTCSWTTASSSGLPWMAKKDYGKGSTLVAPKQ